MALTASTMLALGTPLPPFSLAQLGGGRFSNADLPGLPVLLMVLCAHCPFVKHVEAEIGRLERDYSKRVQLLGVASNSLTTHPQDGPEGLAEQRSLQGWRFPYLLDGDQTLAKALRAACTPDFFLFNDAHVLAYRGQLDGSRPGNGQTADGADLRAALGAVLNGQRPGAGQIAAIGCNIKWHPGQAPDWA
ncbi:thioredoxin family protein [Cyanobium sp. Morenito 9A2]|uniref:thioredoxin family protein n=1 Tax=Cyanobium sp. Morenito 9A2 TaxID=2823718 RepID=UPI0020CE5EE4|nr:thioredoxin family protein [Cyanobium sp. Morenito 9A2]MCP9849598.1 thioredoxin family protein [Cyanobium sp. Morenito 9A2]